MKKSEIQDAEMPKKYENIEKSEANEEIKEYMRGYNRCHDDFLACYLRKMSDRVDVEKIIEILKLYQGGNELHIATEWSFIDLAQNIAKEINEEVYKMKSCKIQKLINEIDKKVEELEKLYTNLRCKGTIIWKVGKVKC